MGVVRMEDSKRVELEELRHMLVSTAGIQRRKDEEEFKGLLDAYKGLHDELQDKVVCVTSGVSFLGLALVNSLLGRGFSVRIIVDNQEDVEKLGEMEMSGEIRTSRIKFSAVMAKLTEVESLMEAFEGCCGVFHTMSFTDPSGLSGYSKCMAEIEVKACENVMTASARTPSVRKCVLTSSLLAFIWRDTTLQDISSVVNHSCWSDEQLCKDKRLWYALGKLRAEKAAWRIAEENELKLVTICPGLITGPDFSNRNPTGTIAYLKGAQEMYANHLLASVDVQKLALAHVCAFEAMNRTASGRYICYDSVIENQDEAVKLAKMVGVPTEKICGSTTSFIPTPCQLSNKKLINLMTRTLRPCFNEI